MAVQATGAPVAAENMPLAGWLTAHGYTEGLAAYWQASSTTVDSGSYAKPGAGGWAVRYASLDGAGYRAAYPAAGRG